MLCHDADNRRQRRGRRSEVWLRRAQMLSDEHEMLH